MKGGMLVAFAPLAKIEAMIVTSLGGNGQFPRLLVLADMFVGDNKELNS